MVPRISEVCGYITFSQEDFPDKRPVSVKIKLSDLRPGNYQVRIHYMGDVSDGCRIGAHRQWYKLHEFNIPEDDRRRGQYWVDLHDHHITIKDELPGILGRAVSLRQVDANGFEDVLACAVIGMTNHIWYKHRYSYDPYGR